MTSPTPQRTDFSIDYLGRYMCNGLDEALQSTNTGSGVGGNPFNVIVIGGGSFGGVFAQHLYSIDKKRAARVLVLERGPLALPEHSQNLPTLGDTVPFITPWLASIPFGGLTFCIGGRSLFWGGWSPELLDAEMPDDRWPPKIKQALKGGLFRDAAEQIGTDVTNDFIYGGLHYRMRRILYDGVVGNQVDDAVPLDRIDTKPPAAAAATDVATLRKLLGGETDGIKTAADLINMMKLEAPLAVQARARSGFFPLNKFSAVPVMLEASRQAYLDSEGDDRRKRLMIVPNCPVKHVRVDEAGRVVAVETALGDVPVPPDGKVVLAAGTIESTRQALLALQGRPGAEAIGRNLMAHLRSNITIRIPRSSLGLDIPESELQALALFLKGWHGKGQAFFHLQITGAGVGPNVTSGETEMWKKIPDIDTMHRFFNNVRDELIVINIRGVGEMEPRNPRNWVKLSSELDEFGVPRAVVSLFASDRDNAVWDTMDRASDQVARVFARGKPFEVLMPGNSWRSAQPAEDLSKILPYEQGWQKRRDGLGSTHHEAGTLAMSAAANGAADEVGRLRASPNLYAVGPALLPTLGSPNPMLSGVALARRLAENLADLAPYQPEAGFTPLFDGFSISNWKMAGPGRFRVFNGALQSVPGNDIGLYWCTTPMPPNFLLRLRWMRSGEDDNSGVFIRFPSPESSQYDKLPNRAFGPVNDGFEVQIDEFGMPDADMRHKTGAIYQKTGDNLPQDRVAHELVPLGKWQEFEITANGNRLEVNLNGATITKFTNTQQGRGVPSTSAAPTFIGLQSHTGTVSFRDIRFKAI
jgi:choline dehydrogenase-like flavoprotein